MDPFTQRMLEKAEQRSRALGISSATDFPLECHSTAKNDEGAVAMASQQQKQLQTTATNTSGTTKMQVVEKKPIDAPIGLAKNKVLRQFATVNKENMDLGIEINIMTDKKIEVQVEVEEKDITDDEADSQHLLQTHNDESMNQPLAKIRDTSRNRLQRLGALYSNTENLSSPIHRTEAQFHADNADDVTERGSSKKLKQRYGKLLALADTINQWEDDTSSHHHVQQHQQHQQQQQQQQQSNTIAPPPKPELPSRRVVIHEQPHKKPPAPQPPVAATKDAVARSATTGAKTKQLKWDPKVITSLEAQGFQRRDSSTIKHTYDYNRDEQVSTEAEATTTQPTTDNTKSTVNKLQKTFTPNVEEQNADRKAQSTTTPTVKSGLVSGRAAIFEHKANSNQQAVQRPQKDPTELTLKERMKLFERNKGEALVPKAAFGMAPSISQIRQDNSVAKKDERKFFTSNPQTHQTNVMVKSNADSKLRDKVAALVANANSASENKIKAEIDKQRQEDMLILTNRFKTQKELFTKDEKTQAAPQQQQAQAKAMLPTTTCSVVRPMPPPPPPPPMPTAYNAACSKRRSPGDVIDEETKRARTSNPTPTPISTTNRLYPALSDLESNASYSDNDNCATTATATASDGHPDEDESYMDSDVSGMREEDDDDDNNDEPTEDSSVGICKMSLGREIMQVVHDKEAEQQQQQKQQKQQQNKMLHKKTKEVRYDDKNYYYDDHRQHDNDADSSICSSNASMGMDEYLDEALGNNNDEHDDDDGDDDFTQEESDNENDSRLSKGSKGTTTSNSFTFRKTPSKYVNCQTINEDEIVNFETPKPSTALLNGAQPVKSELSVNQDKDNLVTLVHTVSFYRRQQSANSANSTPVRKICREQQVLRSELDCGGAKHKLEYDSPQQATSAAGVGAIENQSDEEENSQSEDEVVNNELVQDKIKKLLGEVCKQQQVIGQTSQALNLCAATIEFSGSTESVEGERHLLVATHRRQACLDEVQRLRVEKSLRPLGAPKEKGRLTVKEITIPLRQDYIRKLAADTISGHHLVCLLKYNEHVLATKTVPTLPGLLAVKFPDVLQLNNVYADFRITLEIYGMTAQREVLPHEVKYHINLNKKSGIKTPKKKSGENRLVMPPVQSPAGPNVVRTPALVQYGFAIFSLREIQRTTWSLTQVLGVSPLEGVVHMKVNCELSCSVEYKGFLTMFEDISGFGAWHRRWCHLNGAMLNYWKYPDDEKKKTPMGSIDLYACCSQKVTTAPRDICARLNTMLLEWQRPAKETDQESLIIVPNGRTTIVRCLLSADTKEEREEWSAYFNKALTLLRAWGPAQ